MSRAQFVEMCPPFRIERVISFFRAMCIAGLGDAVGEDGEAGGALNLRGDGRQVRRGER